MHDCLAEDTDESANKGSFFNMQLLITTPRFVLHVDTLTRDVRVVESGRGEYYGISWSLDGQRLALGHSNVDHDSLTDLASYAMSEVGTLSVDGKNAVQPFLSAPHQILWLTQNRIAVTNTGRCTVAIVNVDDGSVLEQRIGYALWDRLSTESHEGPHLNSLHFHNELLYVVAHNFNKGSFIATLSPPSLSEVSCHAVPGLTGIHNMMITSENDWIVCDSFGGGLADGRTGKTLWSAGPQNFTRGLAATKDFFIVGLSERVGRNQRTGTESGIWIVDRMTLRTLDYIYLGHFGSVHEVRIIDEPDLAHHGTPLALSAFEILKQRGTEITRSKIQMAARSLDISTLFRFALGSIDCDEGGVISAATDIAIFRIASQSARGISAIFRVGPLIDVSSHASLVTRYAGPDDTNMIAALIQSQPDGNLSAALWVNHGGIWEMKSTQVLASRHIRRDGLHRLLDAMLTDDGYSIRLEIAGELVLSLLSNDVPSLAQDGFAVRLVGNTVKMESIKPI